MTYDYDVVVAGAGPAGVATAVALVRVAGLDPRRVLVLDRGHFPRAKPCGGGLTGHAEAAMAALGLELRVPFAACQRAALVCGTIRRPLRLHRPVRVIRREAFDADLVAQARGAGVEVREGVGLAGYQVGDGVTISTSDGGRTSCRVLVGADGAGSLVRKRLLQGHPAAPAQPLRLARLELPAPPGFGGSMVYDFSPFAAGLRGYVWLFPVPGGRLNVGIMHYPSSDLGGRALDRLLVATLERHGVALPGPARGWPAWPYDERAPVAAPHLLTVGDAAGIDALTGEGIAVGLEQAIVAARAIAQAFRSGDHRFSEYGREIRRATVGRELALDSLMAQLLYGSRVWQPWLGLVMFDRAVLDLYAARVCGAQVLADHKPALVGALGRQLFLGQERARRIDASL